MIRYKEGYKYVLAETYSVKTDIVTNQVSILGDDFIVLSGDGTLTIKKGYAWDGPSGPTIDTKNFMRGSLVHDALYQLMRENILDKSWFHKSNQELYKICMEDGMSWFRARYVKLGVDLFGHSAICPGGNPVVTAP